MNNKQRKVGRKRVDQLWVRYGFKPHPVVGNRNAFAYCIHCKTALANTSRSRMITHRRRCVAYKRDFSQEIPLLIKFKSHINETPINENPLSPSLDSIIHNDDEEDLELLNIQKTNAESTHNPFPNSRKLVQLQEERTKAESEYYRIKAEYFEKLTENSKIKRTVMVLQSRKLQLEIEKISNDY